MSAYMCSFDTLKTIADFIYGSKYREDYANPVEGEAIDPRNSLAQYQGILSKLTKTNVDSLVALYGKEDVFSHKSGLSKEINEISETIGSLSARDLPRTQAPNSRLEGIPEFLKAEEEWSYQSSNIEDHLEHPAFFQLSWIKLDLLKDLARENEHLYKTKNQGRAERDEYRRKIRELKNELQVLTSDPLRAGMHELVETHFEFDHKKGFGLTDNGVRITPDAVSKITDELCYALDNVWAEANDRIDELARKLTVSEPTLNLAQSQDAVSELLTTANAGVAKRSTETPANTPSLTRGKGM
jgi:hypothetical protein